VFAYFFFWNKVSSNKGGDSNKQNTEQIQFSRQNSISVFYSALREHTVKGEVINFLSCKEFTAGENNLIRACAYLWSEKQFENR